MTPHPTPRRVSVILGDLLARQDGPTVSLGVLLDGLADRSFGLVLLLMAIPGCIPGPPGLSSIFGLPIILFATQMMAGQHRPWLPRFIRSRSVPVATLAGLLRRAEPWIERFERVCRPRLPRVTYGKGERAVGAWILILGLTLSMPIPLSNMVPSMGVAVIALGLVQRDGVMVVIGSAIGVVGMAISATVIWLALMGIGRLLG